MTYTDEDYKLLIAQREGYNASYEEQYKNDTEQWAELYADNFIKLGSYYKRLGQVEKAIPHEEKALSICIESRKPTEDWDKYQALILSNLAFSYAKINQLEKAINHAEEALKIEGKYFDQVAENWVDSFTTSLNNLGQYYEEAGKLEKAIEVQVKALSIIKNQYQLDSSIWCEPYITTLNNLACTYDLANRHHDSLELIMDILHIYKKLHHQEPLTWLSEYVGAIQDVATQHVRLNDYRSAEAYFKLYMNLHSSIAIDDIDFYLDYIYCFVHYVKASAHLPSGSFIKFNEMSDEFKARMKAVFVDEYQVKIEQILSDYLELLTINDPNDNKNRQIVIQYFSEALS